MKRKSIVGLLTVLIAVFALGMTAHSQVTGENLGDGLCTNCKCPLGNIPCPGITEGPQGTIQTDALYPFDFDGEAWEEVDANGFGSYGYCAGFNAGNNPFTAAVADNAERDCKFIFDVCACPDSCEIKPGTKVGVQMIIDVDGNLATVDDGVYFADPDLDRIRFDIFPDRVNGTQLQQNLPCQKTGGLPNVKAMRTGNLYYDVFGNPTPYVANADPDRTVQEVRSFKSIVYYRSYTESNNAKGLYEITFSQPGTPLAGPLNTSVPANNRVVALQSQLDGDYMFTNTDTEGYCVLWIDIPALRIDPSKAGALKGKTIKVRVRLLFNREPTGICTECDPPDLCECIVEVAIVCCGEKSGEGCLFFPYVLQGIEDSGWVSGVAISAREDLPATPSVTLTLMDSQGNKASYTNTNPDPIWTFMVDGLLPDLNGTLTPGAATLEVQSNYVIDGYSFVTDGNFGAGTNPRGCTDCCP